MFGLVFLGISLDLPQPSQYDVIEDRLLRSLAHREICSTLLSQNSAEVSQVLLKQI